MSMRVTDSWWRNRNLILDPDEIKIIWYELLCVYDYHLSWVAGLCWCYLPVIYLANLFLLSFLGTENKHDRASIISLSFHTHTHTLVGEAITCIPN